MLKKSILSLLSNPHVRQIELDSPQRTVLHSRIIRRKPFLRRLYIEWYEALRDVLPESPSGPVLELGSGGGFSKDNIPGVISSEILRIPNVDLVLDAGSLPFRDHSLKGIIMIDVFHHLPQLELFICDAARCIRPGGVIVMIEPWKTPWSNLIYHYFHHEPFEPDILRWEFPRGRPLSQANSALPWIVFKRDRRRFEEKCPWWQIKEIKLHTPFRYLLSGGVSLRSLMPAGLFSLWHKVEKLLYPLMEYLAMFATIILVRKDSEAKPPFVNAGEKLLSQIALRKD